MQLRNIINIAKTCHFITVIALSSWQPAEQLQITQDTLDTLFASRNYLSRCSYPNYRLHTLLYGFEESKFLTFHDISAVTFDQSLNVMASRPRVTRHFVLALFEYFSIWSVVCNTSTEHDMWSIAARNVVNLYEFFCGGLLTLFALRVYWVYIEYTLRRKCETIGPFTSCLFYWLIWWTCLVVTECSFMSCSMKLIDQLYSITKYR